MNKPGKLYLHIYWKINCGCTEKLQYITNMNNNNLTWKSSKGWCDDKQGWM